MRVKTKDKIFLDMDIIWSSDNILFGDAKIFFQSNMLDRQFNQSVYSFYSYITSYQWKTPQGHDGQLVPKQEVPSGGGAQLPLRRAQPGQE